MTKSTMEDVSGKVQPICSLWIESTLKGDQSEERKISVYQITKTVLTYVHRINPSEHSRINQFAPTKSLLNTSFTYGPTYIPTFMTEAKRNSSELKYSTIIAVIAAAVGIPFILSNAIQIRLFAIQDFGTVIHEFDPYFNFRATEYLYEHGRAKFFKWFDYMSWYPLGRPVGTTIYPGMQFTAVWIKNHIVGDAMSLNDVCCYIPVLFGALATFLVGIITYESCLVQNTSEDVVSVMFKAITGKTLITLEKSDKNSFSVPMLSAIFAMFGMSIMPAHLMRSVGGGFDNECVAITAMLLTFYFWIRSLRANEDYSYLFGIIAAIAYFYVSLPS